MALWVMALGEKDESKGPTYAEGVNPVHARASALVRDFGDVFPILMEWRQKIGQEITVYVMSTLEIADDTPAHDTYEAWDRFGPEIRIDSLEGGYLRVSDYRYGDQPGDRAFDLGVGIPIQQRKPE
ncbi:hypothetical protein ACWDBF_17015 [Streptomyces angustmyceticus]